MKKSSVNVFSDAGLLSKVVFVNVLLDYFKNLS